MRSITPSSLGFALAMLILPWIEIRCDANQLGAGGPQGLGPMGFTVIEQNGIQTMTGQYSLGPLLKSAMDKGKERAGANPGVGDVNPLKGLNEKKGDPAVFVIVWAVLAVLGVVIGLALPLGISRTFLLGSCSIAAVACLVIQGFVVKFPAARDMDKQNPAGQQAPQINNQGAPRMNVPQPKMKAVLEIGFWLALAGSVAACVGVVIEANGAKKPRSRRGAGEDLEESGDAAYRY